MQFLNQPKQVMALLDAAENALPHLPDALKDSLFKAMAAFETGGVRHFWTAEDARKLVDYDLPANAELAMINRIISMRQFGASEIIDVEEFSSRISQELQQGSFWEVEARGKKRREEQKKDFKLSGIQEIRIADLKLPASPADDAMREVDLDIAEFFSKNNVNKIGFYRNSDYKNFMDAIESGALYSTETGASLAAILIAVRVSIKAFDCLDGNFSCSVVLEGEAK